MAGATEGGSLKQLDNAANPAALSVVCNHWRELDLESMRSKMDTTAIQIAELQVEALQNRRSLAESTKDFKRATADTSIKGLGPLLKQYQASEQWGPGVKGPCSVPCAPSKPR